VAPVTAVDAPVVEPTTVGEAILDVRDVTVRFGGLLALEDVSFDVRRGELFALIGPNGAGKTTLVNAVTSVYQPQPGATVTFHPADGEPVTLTKLRPYQIARRGVGRTFQNLGSIPKLSVLENLLLGRFSHQRTGIFGGGVFSPRMRREGVAGREVVESIIELLHLARYRYEPVGSLPYGVQKRVELGRVLAMEPQLLMLDEPMAGMSVDEKRDMVSFIFDIRAALRTTVLLIEHDMGVVMAIAERVMVLENGRRIALGSPAEVQRDEQVIAAYLGSE
jgi:branched-chain amino acid transport system ATP-binding protein